MLLEKQTNIYESSSFYIAHARIANADKFEIEIENTKQKLNIKSMKELDDLLSILSEVKKTIEDNT